MNHRPRIKSSYGTAMLCDICERHMVAGRKTPSVYQQYDLLCLELQKSAKTGCYICGYVWRSINNSNSNVTSLRAICELVWFECDCRDPHSQPLVDVSWRLVNTIVNRRDERSGQASDNIWFALEPHPGSATSDKQATH